MQSFYSQHQKLKWIIFIRQKALIRVIFELNDTIYQQSQAILTLEPGRAKFAPKHGGPCAGIHTNHVIWFARFKSGTKCKVSSNRSDQMSVAEDWK